MLFLRPYTYIYSVKIIGHIKRKPETYGLKSLRMHGKAPYAVAVIHGGPGAPGEMEPVARELSGYHGTLEPLQGAASIEGQLQELKAVLIAHASLPVTLIGHSWGAWLSLMFAARNPSFVKKN